MSVAFISLSIAGALFMAMSKQVIHDAATLPSSGRESHSYSTYPQLLESVSTTQQLYYSDNKSVEERLKSLANLYSVALSYSLGFHI